MSLERPVLRDVPAQIGFNENFTIGIDIPDNLSASNVQGEISSEYTVDCLLTAGQLPSWIWASPRMLSIPVRVWSSCRLPWTDVGAEEGKAKT